MIIGVAGKACAGKDAVTASLVRLGALELNGDEMGRAVVEDMAPRIAEVFGSGVIGADSKIDRRALGERVFGAEEELKRLNALVHPELARRIRDKALGVESGCPVVINAALLFELDLASVCDHVVWVKAPLTLRLRRARGRDRRTWTFLIKRLWRQRKLSPQPWRNSVDIITIRNGRSLRTLEQRIEKLFRGWCNVKGS